MKILTVTGYKGGVGKSVTAVHLATYFSEKGKTVLVDGDPNRTALGWAARGKLPFTVADERQAMKMVASTDYVVIDTPARPNSDDLKELAKGCELLVLGVCRNIVLRIYIRTLFESSIDTITKTFKFIPPLPHPILQHKPPMLDLVQVWRISREIPNLASCGCYNFVN